MITALTAKEDSEGLIERPEPETDCRISLPEQLYINSRELMPQVDILVKLTWNQAGF